MRLAVLSICEGLYRVCNLDSGEIKDIDKKSLVQSVENGNQIENVEVRGKRVLSKSKYPVIKNGKVNKDKYYIINSIEGSHLVCNSFGKIATVGNEEMLKMLANTMNPIACNIGKKVKSTSLYGGEYLGDSKYNEVILGHNIFECTDYCYVKLTQYKAVDTRIVSQDYNGSYSINMNNIKVENGLTVIEGDKIIIGHLFSKVNDINILRSLVANEYTIELIDDTIREMEDIKSSKAVKRDNITNIILPTKTTKYKPIVLNSKGLCGGSVIEDTDIINRYMAILSIMNTEIWVQVSSVNGKYLLARTIDKNGIKYKEVGEGYYCEDGTVRIEDVYDNYKEYNNVKLVGNKLIVYGIDGIYEYDIDRVYKEYNSGLIETKRAKKAKLLGYEHEEEINARGELIHLKSNRELLTIPPDVKEIRKEAIYIHPNNKAIIFNDSIEKINRACFKFKYGTELLLNSIEVNITNKACRLNLVKSIARLKVPADELVVFYTYPITTEEIVTFIVNTDLNNRIIIEAPNFNTQSVIKDEEAIKIFKEVCKLVGKDLAKLGKREEYEKFNRGTSVLYNRHTSYTTLVNADLQLRFIQESMSMFNIYFSSEANSKIYETIMSLFSKLRKEVEECK